MRLYSRTKLRRHLFNLFAEEQRYTNSKNLEASSISSLRIFDFSIKTTLKASIEIFDIIYETAYE